MRMTIPKTSATRRSLKRQGIESHMAGIALTGVKSCPGSSNSGAMTPPSCSASAAREPPRRRSRLVQIQYWSLEKPRRAASS